MSVNSLRDIWNQILDILSQELTPTAITTWFSDCEPIDLGERTLVIATGNDFKKEIISSRFDSSIKKALYEIFSCDFDLLVLCGEEVENYRDNQNTSDYPIPEMADYTFDRFIIGKSNEFAYAAAKAVAKSPGGHDYNPLLIYGNSGLGKTHLLFAIGKEIHDQDPSKKIIYIKGDEFINRMTKALAERKTEEFRNEFRNVDLLLADDIQFIAGKEMTQNEFFHTFNAIYEAGKQIVLTSDRPPKDMSLLDDRLRTRFEGGLMADIQPPDYETRIVIIRNKAAKFGLVLSDEAVDYIAKNITSNIRQIEGVIKKLTAYREILNDVITTESVKRAIVDVTNTGIDIPTPEKIIAETARYFSISVEEVKGQNRSKTPALARQISMYLIRTLTTTSLVNIGDCFEGRNHATVLSSIKKIEELMESDSKMPGIIRDITSNINAK